MSARDRESEVARTRDAIVAGQWEKVSAEAVEEAVASMTPEQLQAVLTP